MTINLTETGWVDDNGNLLGEWSSNDESVFGDDGINIAAGITVDTLSGQDRLENNSVNSSIVIGNNATLRTNNGDDVLFSKGFVAFDLASGAVLDTGNGNDQITGEGFDGFFLGVSSAIFTGEGDDKISGTGAAVGINSRGRIDTGNGNDRIFGEATDLIADFFGSTGISNFLGTIETGNGDDQIVGKGLVIGINNPSGIIDTGNGNDIVDALSGGFADPDGTGQINLGAGDDLIRGFGDHRGTVDGGSGRDRAELGFDYDENLISFGSGSSTSLDITYESEMMAFDNIEMFNFNGQEFSLAELQANI